MIKSLDYSQYNKITCGKFCFCRTKQKTIFQEQVGEGVYCGFICCHYLNKNNKVEAWSVLSSNWNLCHQEQKEAKLNTEDLLWSTIEWTNNLNKAE